MEQDRAQPLERAAQLPAPSGCVRVALADGTVDPEDDEDQDEND